MSFLSTSSTQRFLSKASVVSFTVPESDLSESISIVSNFASKHAQLALDRVSQLLDIEIVQRYWAHIVEFYTWSGLAEKLRVLCGVVRDYNSECTTFAFSAATIYTLFVVVVVGMLISVLVTRRNELNRQEEGRVIFRSMPVIFFHLAFHFLPAGFFVLISPRNYKDLMPAIDFPYTIGIVSLLAIIILFANADLAFGLDRGHLLTASFFFHALHLCERLMRPSFLLSPSTVGVEVFYMFFSFVFNYVMYSLACDFVKEVVIGFGVEKCEDNDDGDD